MQRPFAVGTGGGSVVEEWKGEDGAPVAFSSFDALEFPLDISWDGAVCVVGG